MGISCQLSFTVHGMLVKFLEQTHRPTNTWMDAAKNNTQPFCFTGINHRKCLKGNDNAHSWSHLSLGTRLIVSRKHKTLELSHNQTSALVNPCLIRNWNAQSPTQQWKTVFKKYSLQARWNITEKYTNRSTTFEVYFRLLGSQKQNKNNKMRSQKQSPAQFYTNMTWQRNFNESTLNISVFLVDNDEN